MKFKYCVKYPLATLSLSLLAIVTYLSPRLTAWFIYDREALLNGEVWRLWSAHWVHFSTQHLGYDVIAFSIIGSLIELYSRLKWLLLCSLMAFFISLILFLVEPDMRYYGGLSGLVVGGLIYLALLHSDHRHYPLFWGIVLFVTMSKMGLEIFYHTAFFSEGNFVPMPLSHLVGSLVATIFFFLSRSR